MTDTYWGLEPELELWITDCQEPVRIRLTGRLSAPTAVHLGEVLASLQASGHEAVQFDFDRVDSVDGEGLGVLVRVVCQAVLDGWTVSVVDSSELVRRALDLNGLGSAVDKRPT